MEQGMHQNNKPTEGAAPPVMEAPPANRIRASFYQDSLLDINTNHDSPKLIHDDSFIIYSVSSVSV